MLCDTCHRMLRHQAGLRENRRVELRFDHHERTTALRQAADLGCSICSALARQLEREHFDLEDDRYIDLQAALASICGSGWKSGYYSLDFLLDGRWMRTFALRPRGEWMLGLACRRCALADLRNNSEAVELQEKEAASGAHPFHRGFPARTALGLGLQMRRRATRLVPGPAAGSGRDQARRRIWR
ncbi:hypothetical protein BK809_0005058 [Diplodia seriata]|uniref:Uncharacterized protein n=1 Tax=Diplodia seriata TaxID=420778 RepID=A0A1S8B802_9PEZI|nr:hypothetical protein BK809_0005058 [Diplodia seriata]